MFTNVRMKKKPAFMIIPMIDIIFFLLVFFMMNSLQTVAQKALSVQLPQAQSAAAPVQMPIIPVSYTHLDVYKRQGADGAYIAREILLHTPAVAQLIRSGREHQLATVMQTGAALGMRTMEQALQRHRRNLI